MAEPAVLRNNQMLSTEARLRRDLAAAIRLVHYFKWDDIVATHISVRIPGPEHHFLINPYGLMFDEVTASSLVKIGVDGQKVDGSPYEVNPAGFTIHSAIHEDNADAQCVMHLHTIFGIAVASQKRGLLPLNMSSMLLNEAVAYHDFEGLSFNHDERPRLAANLGNKRVLILRNHGTLTVGKTVGEAFNTMYWLERSCQTQIYAASGGAELNIPKDEVQAVVKNQADAVSEGFANNVVWPALLRMLDRQCPDYKS
jgi:ribulose-5-phosphate 4-epimerase/fuculose-1-phosphate aldolase